MLFKVIGLFFGGGGTPCFGVESDGCEFFGVVASGFGVPGRFGFGTLAFCPGVNKYLDLIGEVFNAALGLLASSEDTELSGLTGGIQEPFLSNIGEFSQFFPLDGTVRLVVECW